MTKDELREIVRELRNIEQRVNSLEKSAWWKRIFSLSRIRKRFQEKQAELDRELKKWLEQNNEEFAQLAQENLKLLERQEVIYKVKTLQYSPVGTYSAYFRGKLFPDGYAHLELSRTNIGFYPLSKYDFVSKFLGTIDYLGNIELKPVKIQSSFAFSRPRFYRGYVNDKGVMVLTVTRRDLEMVSGHVVMGGLIGLHFDQDEKLHRFFDNRKRLLDIITTTKEQLLENIQTQ